MTDAQITEYAARVMRQQYVEQGPLRDRAVVGGRPLSPEVVAAVLHALADHTHNRHMVQVIVDEAALADDIVSDPRTSSLGRYFHRLAGAIEDAVSAERIDERARAFEAAMALGRAADYCHDGHVTVPTELLRTLVLAVRKGVL